MSILVNKQVAEWFPPPKKKVAMLRPSYTLVALSYSIAESTVDTIQNESNQSFRNTYNIVFDIPCWNVS